MAAASSSAACGLFLPVTPSWKAILKASPSLAPSGSTGIRRFDRVSWVEKSGTYRRIGSELPDRDAIAALVAHGRLIVLVIWTDTVGE